MSEDQVPLYGTPDSVPGAQPPRSRPEPGSPQSPVARDEQHFAVLGGLRRTGRWSVPRRTMAFSVIGGVDLDLLDASFPPGDVVLLHVSVIGGVEVTVPDTVEVRVEGLRLIGGQKVRHAAGPVTTTLVIRSFGILGGVKVRRR